MSLTPSVAHEDDGTALEARFSIRPAAAFETQCVGLEARLQWWLLADHRGDVDKEILGPLSRCLSAYIRRTRSQGGVSSYSLCKAVFEAIHHLVEAGTTSPRLSSKAPLVAIYQTMETLCRETGRLDEAVSWAVLVRNALDPEKDSTAKCCSASAQLLSLHLKDPAKYLLDDALLAKVLGAIEGPMRGDVTELEELLMSMGYLRKSAMNLLFDRGGTAFAEHQIPESTKQLLETFIYQCPRFYLRWLGKPPASKSSTKDFLRYEQRRQLMTKSIGLILDSALVVIKTLIDDGRIDWALMDAVLADCLTLLDYLDDAKLAGPAASYHVKISHFYYLNYRALKDSPVDADGVDAITALRRSVDCVKHRPKEEKEKSQLVWKLERIADMCKSHGHIAEALGALQSVRTSLVDDGTLQDIAQALTSQPPLLAWTADDNAAALSRALVALHRLEQVHLDWTQDMTEMEQAAVLEHRLHFVLAGGTKNKHDVTLAHPCVDSLLRIYYPTRFPVRRLRTLLHLLSINLDRPDVLADVSPQISAAIGLAESRDLGEDAALGCYLPYYQPMYTSLCGLSEGYPDLESLRRCLSDWDRLFTGAPSKDDLDKSVDNEAEFLAHLRSIADFARTMGEGDILIAALQLSGKATRPPIPAGRR